MADGRASEARSGYFCEAHGFGVGFDWLNGCNNLYCVVRSRRNASTHGAVVVGGCWL